MRLYKMWDTMLQYSGHPDARVVSHDSCCVCDSIEQDEHGGYVQTCAVCHISCHRRCFQVKLKRFHSDMEASVVDGFDYGTCISNQFQSDDVLCPSCAVIGRHIYTSSGASDTA